MASARRPSMSGRYRLGKSRSMLMLSLILTAALSRSRNYNGTPGCRNVPESGSARLAEGSGGRKHPFETVEDHSPTLGRALGIVCQHVFMGQYQLAFRAVRNNIDGDTRVFGREFGNREGEHEAARPIDFEIFACVLDFFAVLANDRKAAADARINLDTRHLTGWRGE